MTACSLDAEFLDLFPRYLANRGRDVEAIAAALERGDFQLILRIGHNMHGSGRTFGLDELSAMGAAIERAAQAADRAGVLHELPRISAYLSGIDVTGVQPHAAPGGTADPAAAYGLRGAGPARENEQFDVFLVDDQEINVAIIGRFLRREGYRVKSLDSGEAALAALAVPPLPAIILLDVVMSGADGLTTCRRIKSSPATRRIPVVLVSSAGSGEDRSAGQAAGADGFLSKPVCRDELIETVRSLLAAAKRPGVTAGQAALEPSAR